MDMKNLKKKILGAVFGVFAAISLTVPSYAAVCVSGSADSLQQDPHYKEVSEIAEGLSECMPNEAQKKYVYSVTMTSVFGKRYHSGWSSSYMDGDLIVELSVAESEQIPAALANLYFPSGKIIYRESDRVEMASVQPVPLNAQGINEASYQGIREIYRRYQEVRNGASDLGEMEKIRYIHEYLVNTLEPVPAGETQMEDAHWIQNVFSGQYAYCIAYTNLFYLFGRGCGLEVGHDGGKDGGHGVRNHVRNTVTMNGELRYLDVMWDDDPVDPDRYYLTKECSLKEYH